MGVAFGKFVPAAGYETIAAHCKSGHADQFELAFSVQTEDGSSIPCIGIGLLDYSEQMGEPYAELTVFGIAHTAYAAIFPQHLASYNRQFGVGDGTE
jgi:hypothetical protein